MTAADGKQFLAADAYPTWRRRVKSAKTSVRIYSPYLDRLAVDLLGHADPDQVVLSVLTDLSPASGTLDYRGQLLALKRLIDRGIEIRSLPRLNAKVLLVDDETVTVGSQNFTSYARRSHETTVFSTTDMSESRFVETLERWWVDAEPVDIELLEGLRFTHRGRCVAAVRSPCVCC